MTDYDVIIVGAGGAGLAAASAASENGASVLIVEAAARAGGSTALSGGVFYAAGTSLQREAGIEGDAPDAVFQYYMTLNQYKLEASLVRKLCDDSPAAFEWLRSIGVEFRAEDLYMSGVDKVRRGHRAAGGGAAIAEALEGSFAGRSVDVALETRVETLLIEEGRICGVIVDGQPVRSSATIITTGGFGANPAMLAQLYPDAAIHGDQHWYIGAPTCRGDGILMAQAAGGQISAANRGLLLLTPGFAKELESYVPGWLMMVNREGRRFVDESIEYSVMAAVLGEQEDRIAFGIFDEASRMASKTTSYRPAPNWTADRLDEFVAAGTLEKADSIAGLAERIGISPDVLHTTVNRYNDHVSDKADGGFFKPASFLRPITSPPFYAARICAAIICWTGTGLRIDTRAQVLDAADRPIPGLYAAGETTGGMFGECYASGGASIGNAIIFGLTAGREAAALARLHAPLAATS
ncbi:FAD-binding protein [Sphingobium phenoxybenzoativorans]|uniref:FAD-binding protein n=1 Tax=Sphingobium phenoxybenzoativorans TaxID=1592790 RepID=A0A975K9L8_9SPHN|nr:FAD-dependent oxidoreductase [Sphingobium phenoxybenzoativorans]QUT07358.1 FAD-binding protein [Sphingobium phenoxybenzoativorans]